MTERSIKETAEAALRELPGVVGAFVQPDAFGHPREIHLLIQPGPRPREFAQHVKSVLESRLRIPIDQRVISIAQLAEERRDDGAPPAAPVTGAETSLGPEPTNGFGLRLRLGSIETRVSGIHVTVEVRLLHEEQEIVGEATEIEPGSGRARAAALATVQALNQIAGPHARLGLDFASPVEAVGQPYVIASVAVTSPQLGRRSVMLNGAQRIEEDAETAAALAVLKATNRLLAFLVSGEARRRSRPGLPAE